MSLERCTYCERTRDTDFESFCECDESLLRESIIEELEGVGYREEFECKADNIMKLVLEYSSEKQLNNKQLKTRNHGRKLFEPGTIDKRTDSAYVICNGTR